MTSPIQRSLHSDLPEGPGRTGFTSHADVQRDLWRFLLPIGHVQVSSLLGGGVIRGLEVSATVDSPSLTVTPGLALDARGRLLVVSPSVNDDLRVRLRRTATADVGNEGLVPVSDAGVELPTAGLGGVQYVVLEWNETRLTLDEGVVYRLTPWLHLEAQITDPSRPWAVLARVTLGTGGELGRVKALAPGPRRTLTSLRDGLTFRQPLTGVHPPGAPPGSRISDHETARLGVDSDGSFELLTRGSSGQDWRRSLFIDNVTGNVTIGTDPDRHLIVGGMLQSAGIRTQSLTASATTLGETAVGALTANAISAATVQATGAISADVVHVADTLNADSLNAGSINVTGMVVADMLVANDLVQAESMFVAEEVRTGTVRASGEIVGETLRASGTVHAQAVNAAAITLESLRLPVIRAGRTGLTTTPWQQNTMNELFLRVDTSSAGFTSTPLYFATLMGAGSQQVVTGTSAITNPTPTSFDLFIRTPTQAPETWSLSVNFAMGKQWHVNWVGILPR